MANLDNLDITTMRDTNFIREYCSNCHTMKLNRAAMHFLALLQFVLCSNLYYAAIAVLGRGIRHFSIPCFILRFPCPLYRCYTWALHPALQYPLFHRRISVFTLQVLYLGAASGTTVSHVSDIVGPEGLVYAVEFSHRSGRDLINVAKKRTNIIPIIEDARHPHKYRYGLTRQKHLD